MTDQVLLNHKTRLIEAAKRYAAADRSDPFAFNRAMAHLSNGVCTGDKNHYDAELHHELRSIEMPNGHKLEWQAEVYRNLVRP